MPVSLGRPGALWFPNWASKCRVYLSLDPKAIGIHLYPFQFYPMCCPWMNLLEEIPPFSMEIRYPKYFRVKATTVISYACRSFLYALRNTNNHFWRRCRGTVAIFIKPSSSLYLYPFPFIKTKIFLLPFSTLHNSYKKSFHFKGRVRWATTKTKTFI